MTIHIDASAGDIAETVLLPGDPLRAEWVAETFLDEARCINRVRGMLGFTGRWRGHPVTVHGSGMGMPSLSIYANELIRDYGARTLIRIGSAGGFQPQLALRDIVLAMAASTAGSPSRTIFRELGFAPVADWGLLAAAKSAADARGIPVHVGGIYSSDTFYDERSDLWDQLRRHGCLCVEMETAELYTVALRYGARALAILTISDRIGTGEALSAADRERGFADMVGIALEAAFPSAP
ncbi:purine-nucleoside phosphorylase [Rubellimicrobium sp. CFH 75288]|uniref:purine-nucleoside phosphorylase n=1 Tax=Rubellimicrobium sp. CFH 75288 TaxID=2697034 RepID=UPI001411BE4D|nr:purine-nucleoside phosphorylase [Rubellimicrobium sp. CFH 75288]NAZ37398.1 purine-nucleoside phosphorylase [Rubellimicrobium sp. CFH 75288]